VGDINAFGDEVVQREDGMVFREMLGSLHVALNRSARASYSENAGLTKLARDGLGWEREPLR